MKKKVSILSLLLFSALFVFVSCNQTGQGVQDDLAEMREENMELIAQIDETLAMNDVSEFRDEAGNVIDNIDSQIDDYQNTMDNAGQNIDREAREAIIDMKQKKAALEFKLDLLENGEATVWEDDQRTGTDWTGDQEGRQQTEEEWEEGRDRQEMDAEYSPELFQEIKNDLQELRDGLQEFTQRHL